MQYRAGQMGRQQGRRPVPSNSITPSQIAAWARENPLDAAALATAPVPVLGDLVGGAADLKGLLDEPSLANAGLLAAGMLPFVPAGTVSKVGKGLLSGKKSSKVDDVTGLPLNEDGTVTLYHATPTKEAAENIQKTGELRSAAEPDVYASTAQSGTGYGDYVVPIRVNPKQIELDDEFPDGRMDFRISTGKPGGSIKVGVDLPTDEASRIKASK